MDPITVAMISTLVQSMVANVLTNIVCYGVKKGYEAVKGKEPLKPPSDTTLTPTFQKAIAKLARYGQFDDPIQSEKLKKFLISPDVEAVIRKVYSSKILQKKDNTLNSIREEFIALFVLHVTTSSGKFINSYSNEINEIFDSLLTTCDDALQAAINRGLLVAHDAKSNIRHQILLDEIAAIPKNLALLTGKQQLDISAILEFEEKYRDLISNRHRSITPPNFDNQRKVPIDKLYVPPNFMSVPNSTKEQSEVIKIDDFRSVLYRSVLLGNPGGGKSTLTYKLCYDLATRYSERLYRGREVTPIHVILRDYALDKKEHKYSILEFIQAEAKSKYQIPPTPLSTFEYLLLNGRVMIFFDGLDELLDTSSRQTIRDDVESFCSLYPSVPVLVTSREVGYHEAPLDEEKFAIFRLSSFDDEQVKDYVNKYFRVGEFELEEEEQRNKKVEAFIGESHTVPDLRSNPLMLALLCNIYQGEGYIPKNRPDVYEKCALMLFERWDKSRRLIVSLSSGSIMFVIMYLAYWIYTNEPLQGGVTERKLIEKAIDYLFPRKFEDRDDAEKAGREFIEFFRGRAWVLTDTGTMKDGEKLYQFTHQTFLEYFAAKHLVRTSRDLNTLQEILVPRISKGEWDVVAQLAFRIQDKETEGRGDELLSALIEKSYEAQENEKGNLIFFAARCLDFMVPAPLVRQKITKACIEFSLEWGLERIKNESLKKYLSAPKLLSILLNSDAENIKTIAKTWKELIIQYINGNDESKSIIACIMGIDTKNLITYSGSSGKIISEECINLWNSVSRIIFYECIDRIKELSLKSYEICIFCFRKKEVSIIDLLKWHGLNSIFELCSRVMLPGLSTIPIAAIILDAGFSSLQSLKKDCSTNELDELGKFLTSCITHSITQITELEINSNVRILSTFISNVISYDYPNTEQLTNNTLFAAFYIVAVSLEMSTLYFSDDSEAKNIETNKIINFFKANRFPLLYYTFLSRFDPMATNKMRKELEKSNLTIEQQNFMRQWGQGEINLVAVFVEVI